MVTAAAAKSLQSCPTLCDPIDRSPPGFPVPGILHARTLEWVAISFSNAWKWKVKVKSLSHIPTLSDPKGRSPPGSSIHGIFQARILEWVAIPFSSRLSRHRDQTQIFCITSEFFTAEPLGKSPWFWERLRAGKEGDDRGWDGWMASLTRWTWVWASLESWWWTGKPGVLRSMGS